MTMTVVPVPAGADALALDYEDVVLIWETPELVALGQCLVLTGSAALPYLIDQSAAAMQTAIAAQYPGQMQGLATQNLGNVYFAPAAATAVRQLAEGVVVLMADGAYFLYPSRTFFPTVAAFIAVYGAFPGAGGLGVQLRPTITPVTGVIDGATQNGTYLRVGNVAIFSATTVVNADGVANPSYSLTGFPDTVGQDFVSVDDATAAISSRLNDTTILVSYNNNFGAIPLTLNWRAAWYIPPAS